MGEAKRRKKLDPDFGKGLINRYTSNKDYYSYEDDFVPYVKEKFDDFKDFEEINPLTPVNLKNFLNFLWVKYNRFYDIRDKINGGDRCASQWIVELLMMQAYIKKFPVYYVHTSLYELCKRTSFKSTTFIPNLFINNALFLFPKTEFIKYAVFSTDYTTSSSDICYGFRSSDDKYYFKEAYNNTFYNTIATQNKTTGIIRIDDTSKIVGCIIQALFLYMATYREKAFSLEVSGVTNNKDCFKEGAGGLKTPLTIGLNEEAYYRNQLSQANPALQGIKKATHWRRGHYRRMNNDKLIWIRPTLINKTETENNF